METIDIVRLMVFLGGLGALFLVETLYAARRWQGSRGRRLGVHAGMAVINTVILRLLAVGPFLFLAHWVAEQGWGLASLLGYDGFGEIVVTIVLFDMFDYWWHRFNHRLGFLWRFHKAHHVDTHVDVTTALRFHPGELLISMLVKASWIVFWGPSLVAFAAFEASVSLASQFHHSNIDFPDRVERILRQVIVTPRFHTSHHTVSRRTGDANFSTIFIVWDRLFGTYREPDFVEMRRLGLAEGRDDYLSFAAWLREPVRNRNQDQEYRPSTVAATA